MKKLIYSGFLALAGLFFMNSCVNEDAPKVTFNPEAVEAPTLGSIAGTTLASDGEPLVVDFTTVDYGFACVKNYVLYMSDTETFDRQEKVTSTIDAESGKITISAANLNSAILNLDGKADTPKTVCFRLSSWMATDKGTSLESSQTVSNVVTAEFTPYNTNRLDKDIYDHIWVQGAYCGWSHDNSQFLYNYNKDGNTFTGVVDFADQASGGIKFTGAANWEEATGNWGSADSSEEAEIGQIQLVNNGGNINAYSKRFYHFTFDKSTLLLTKDWGADQIGIIGSFNSWGGDVVMSFNPVYMRFYADLELSSDSEVKFRADADWTLNWGADCVVGGSNISVEAGNYRVYLDLNKNTITFDAKMYGKDEPMGDEESYPETMYMIGEEFGNWTWDAEGVVDLTPTNGVKGEFWTIRYITAEKGFKFCSTKAWSGDFYELDNNSGFTTDDGNCFVAESGIYMIHIDLANSKLNIEKAQVYGIGDCFGGWNEGMSAALFSVSDKTLTAKVAADGELRMYAASSIATTDWWTREFIILDGKIVYRGNGGDQERVKVTAGQAVTLDFNAGTGEIK